MAYVFDTTKIVAGNAAVVSFPGSDAKIVSGRITGIHGTTLNIEYRENGQREVLQADAQNIVNGSLDFQWITANQAKKHYPEDDLVFDDGSNDDNYY